MEEYDPFKVVVNEDGTTTDKNVSTPEQKSFDELCSQYESLSSQIDKLDFKKKTVFEQIIKTLPDTAGVHTKKSNNFEVTLKRRENWIWDSPKLQAIYGTSIPHFVNQNLSVHRKNYKNLTTTEQKELDEALTIKHVKPSIEVRSLNDV
jgi:hypothetical protein